MTGKMQFDVVIVGGGPAGMAAALWCDELDLSLCLIERSSDVGGQLHWIHNPIANYAGAKFSNGLDCLRGFKDSLAGRRSTLISDANVVSIDPVKKTTELEHGETVSGKAIILASGVRRRALGIRGEDQFAGRGILTSGSRDRREASGARVAVIGGGDAALENALILSEYASRVYLVHRRDRFSARREFIKEISRHKNIETVLDARVTEFGGSEMLEFIDIDRMASGTERIRIDKAVVRIGVQPNSELLAGVVDVDEAGYIVTDRVGRTSVENIYAIGDVAFRESPTISTAVGSSAAAIKCIAANIRKSE